MEADLQDFYGIDLAGIVDGSLSWRRLGVLVRQLPREARTVRAQYGAEADWGQVEHLLAGALDLLAEANWQRAGDKKQPHPKPVPRPGERTRTKLSTTELRDRLLEQRRRRESA